MIDILDSKSTAVERRLRVFSSGKRGVVFRYLWLKYLWAELTTQEFFLFVSLPETLRDPMIVAVLTLRAKGLPKGELRKALNVWESLNGERVSSREAFHSIKGLHLEIWLITRRLRPVKKYTGYIKSIASLGKSRVRVINRFELLMAATFDTEVRDVEFYVEVLTVGGIPRGWTTLTRHKNAETELPDEPEAFIPDLPQ